MLEDPLSFVPAPGGGVQGSLLELGSRMNPLLKAPLEWMTGQTFFQKGPSGGRELEDLDPTIGRTMASIGRLAANPRAILFGGDEAQVDPVRIPYSLEFFAMNTPFSRALTTARTLTDPRKSLAAKAINLGTGVRVTDVSPAAQDAILQERAAELLKDLGGKEFAKPYFPKERKERLSAAELAKVETLQQILNELARRRKARSVRQAELAK